MSSDLIAALDAALAVAGEDIILRRRVGEPPNVTYVPVTCRARVDEVNSGASPAGIKLSEFSLILSPTQIDRAQWPGGTIAVPPPFDVDRRIPRENDCDEVIMRGQSPRVVTFCDPKVINGELVRLNLRCVA